MSLNYLLGAAAHADSPIIYPAKGQSPQDLDVDKTECYAWAKDYTKFDPANPSIDAGPAATAGANSNLGNATRTAAGGAAAGAIIGAIAGDAGAGAAIGAAAGGLGGATRNRRLGRRDRNAQQAHDQQQNEKIAQLQGGYDKAFSACLEGRGYTVK